MDKKKQNSLLSKLRARKTNPKSINPGSASSIIRSYIQPRLNRDYIISSRSSLVRSHCSSPQSCSTPSMSSQLSQDLNSTFSTLFSIKHQLDTTLKEKQALEKLISDYKSSNTHYLITTTTLDICLYQRKTPEKRYEELKDYEKLATLNRHLRQSVEKEQAVNNIRLFFIFSLTTQIL